MSPIKAACLSGVNDISLTRSLSHMLNGGGSKQLSCNFIPHRWFSTSGREEELLTTGLILVKGTNWIWKERIRSYQDPYTLKPTYSMWCKSLWVLQVPHSQQSQTQHTVAEESELLWSNNKDWDCHQQDMGAGGSKQLFHITGDSIAGCSSSEGCHVPAYEDIWWSFFSGNFEIHISLQ